jgi:hypothetical protein
VTFTNVEGINIYEDANAFYKEYEWRRVPTPNTRETDGRIRLTSEQRSHFELVNGTKGRSGEQFDIWSAVFGPVGKDGYPELIFDKRTGEINKRVAQYWQQNATTFGSNVSLMDISSPPSPESAHPCSAPPRWPWPGTPWRTSRTPGKASPR